MIRRVSFIRRKAELTPQEFFSHWTGRHAEIVRQLPGLRGLRFSRVDRCVPAEAQWDGVGETWFDSIVDADRAFADGSVSRDADRGSGEIHRRSAFLLHRRSPVHRPGEVSQQ